MRMCGTCGNPLERCRYPSGRLESHAAFKKRKYCSLSCANKRKSVISEMNAAEVKQQAYEVVTDGNSKKQSAFEYLVSVINTDGIDAHIKVVAAKALLPYQEKKAGSVGKKDQQAEAAKEAGEGFFRPMRGPKVLNLRKGE